MTAPTVATGITTASRTLISLLRYMTNDLAYWYPLVRQLPEDR
ncbi:hypothetical protein ACU639_18050 [Streptomyces cynarae]